MVRRYTNLRTGETRELDGKNQRYIIHQLQVELGDTIEVRRFYNTSVLFTYVAVNIAGALRLRKGI